MPAPPSDPQADESSLTTGAASPSATAAAALSRLLARYGRALASDLGGDVAVAWHYSGSPSSLWGLDLRMGLDAIGCSTRDPVEGIRCFLNANSDVWGLDASATRLALLSVVPLRDGRGIYRFRQRLAGVSVDGADVSVTLDASRAAITRVTSSTVRGLKLAVSETALAGAQFPKTVPAVVDGAIRAAVGGEYSRLADPVLALSVDQRNASLDATPVWRLKVKGAGGAESQATIDFGVTSVRGVSQLQHAGLSYKLYTQAAYPTYTNTACFLPGPFSPECLLSGTNWCLASPAAPPAGHCIQTCSGTACSAYGPLWNCKAGISWDGGMCYLPFVGAQGVLLYDTATGGWKGNYANSKYFVHLQEAQDAWNVFTQGDLGRNGWDLAGHGVAANLTAGCIVGDNCQYGATGGGGLTNVNQWGTWDSDDAAATRGRYHLIGHEGAHSITGFSFGQNEPGSAATGDEECLDENLSDLWGSLFARKHFPTDSAAYSGYGGAGYRPYAHLSHYDFLACPGEGQKNTGQACTQESQCPPYYTCSAGTCAQKPDEHNNSNVWGSRFAQLLVEGSSALGAGEDLGLTWNGLGLALAVDVLYEAWAQVAPSSTQLAWADLIAGAAAAHGADTLVATRYALGAIGFPGALFDMGVSTDIPPRGLRWDEWPNSGSNIRVFYLHRDPVSKKIKATYHSGGAWKTDTVSSGAVNDAPTAVVYDHRLHVLYRDPSTNSIKVRRLQLSGAWEAENDLGSGALNLKAGGAFDAATFQGSLYLGFVRPGTTSLSIARCTSNDSTGCGTAVADWKPFSTGKYDKDLAKPTTHGVALEAGSGLADTGGGELLYALTAAPGDGALRVVRVGTTDAVVDERAVPTVYPSYQADANAVRGLVLRDSSVPAEGRVLHLTWNAKGTDQIYASVLSRWNTGGNTGWFTRSVPMVDGTSSGASFWRHDSVYSARHVFASGWGTGRYAVIWTRY
jgi:hypothetical protein